MRNGPVGVPEWCSRHACPFIVPPCAAKARGTSRSYLLMRAAHCLHVRLPGGTQLIRRQGTLAYFVFPFVQRPHRDCRTAHDGPDQRTPRLRAGKGGPTTHPKPRTNRCCRAAAASRGRTPAHHRTSHPGGAARRDDYSALALALRAQFRAACDVLAVCRIPRLAQYAPACHGMRACMLKRTIWRPRCATWATPVWRRRGSTRSGATANCERRLAAGEPAQDCCDRMSMQQVDAGIGPPCGYPTPARGPPRTDKGIYAVGAWHTSRSFMTCYSTTQAANREPKPARVCSPETDREAGGASGYVRPVERPDRRVAGHA